MDLQAKVLEIVARESGKEVTPETRLEQLGLESLEFLDLILSLQAELKAEIPDSAIAKLETVGDLVKAAEGTLVTQ